MVEASTERRLAAIVATDVAGYSPLMGADERGTLEALSRFHQFFVIARNSSFTYKGKAVDVKQVARELGVQHVIEGSVRRAGMPEA